jgi:hypothetical protein
MQRELPMHTVKAYPRLRDRVALLAVAALVSTALLITGLVLSTDSYPRALWVAEWQTIFLYSGAAWTMRNAVQERNRKVRWPMLWVTLIAPLLMHCLILGWVLFSFDPHWRWIEWTTLTIIEAAIVAYVLELVYKRSLAK